MKLRFFLICLIILAIGMPVFGKKHHHRRHSRRTHQYCVPYEIMPGDTLSGLARQFGVRQKNILYRGRHIRRLRIGRTVKVCAPYHVAPYFKEYYVVRRGDNLGRIAKRLKIPLKRLQRWNRYRIRRSRSGRRLIRPGQRLIYLKRGSALSSSIGAPFRGRLINGVRMHSGPGYFVRNPTYSWGTDETVRSIVNAIACFRAKHPHAPKVVIADLSRRYGGRLKHHKSHRSGRDADIGLFAVRGNSQTDIPNHRASDLNVPLTWGLMKCVFDTGKVYMIFLDYRMQKRIYKYLEVHPNLIPRGYTLRNLLEYPEGKHSHSGVIRYEPGHRSHFHVRFVCPKGDGACRDY